MHTWLQQLETATIQGAGYISDGKGAGTLIQRSRVRVPVQSKFSLPFSETIQKVPSPLVDFFFKLEPPAYTAWSLIELVTLLHVGPLGAPLSKRFDAGWIVAACGAVTGLSLVAASFVVTPPQLAVCALVAGKGMSVVAEFISRMDDTVWERANPMWP